MDYKIVTLKEKIVVGFSAVTSNSDDNMSAVIGGLWEKMYKDGVCNTIKNRVNANAIGLYSDYDADKYSITVGVEVLKADNSELCSKIIPASRYAKFSIQGHMVAAVGTAWNEIWQMDLPRSFTGDFEEYLNNDLENADIDIYIALQ